LQFLIIDGRREDGARDKDARRLDEAEWREGGRVKERTGMLHREENDTFDPAAC
jgi:hypothetical protein